MHHYLMASSNMFSTGELDLEGFSVHGNDGGKLLNWTMETGYTVGMNLIRISNLIDIIPCM